MKEQKRNNLLRINLKKDSLRDINEELSALSNLRAVTHLTIDFVPITTCSVHTLEFRGKNGVTQSISIKM